MALKEFSQFWMLDPVKDDNIYLLFDEGIGEISAEVEIGEYTISNITSAIEAAMNSVGVNTYSVTLDRATRKYTITSTIAFSLLITSGTQIGVDIFPLLGFSGADTGFSLSHESNNEVGKVYKPQFKLQSYIDDLSWQESTSASVSTTASGLVEVVSFGNTKFIEFNIMFATNIPQGASIVIRDNITGYNDLVSFMKFITTKSTLEFIKDESDINTFTNILLESLKGNSNGVGFKLDEMTKKSLPDYYETGVMKFRVVN